MYPIKNTLPRSARELARKAGQVMARLANQLELAANAARDASDHKTAERLRQSGRVIERAIRHARDLTRPPHR